MPKRQKAAHPIQRHYDSPTASRIPSAVLHYDLRWAYYVMEIHRHRRDARIRTFGQPASPAWTRFVSCDSAKALTQYANSVGYRVVDGPLFDGDTQVLPQGTVHSEQSHTTIGEALFAALQEKA